MFYLPKNDDECSDEEPGEELAESADKVEWIATASRNFSQGNSQFTPQRCHFVPGKLQFH